MSWTFGFLCGLVVAGIPGAMCFWFWRETEEDAKWWMDQERYWFNCAVEAAQGLEDD